MNPIIKTEDLTKKYGNFIANDNISIEITDNSVHAIVGENGAGKSTFVNMIYGSTLKTSGKIFIKGSEVNYKSTKDAINMGIGMVSQHFRLIPTLTTTENIILGTEYGSKFFLDRKKAAADIEKLMDEYSLFVDSKALVKDISVGAQQRVEILKALYRKSDILILDEPTAVLTPQEIRELGDIIQKLKKLGKTIIIITHKLQEVMDFTDRITVFRLGKLTGDLITKNTSVDEIVEKMIGRSAKIGGKTERKSATSGVPALKVECLNYSDKSGKNLNNISFEVKKGEIVGIAGVDGSGQSELIHLLSGVYRNQNGTIQFNGENVENLHVKDRRNKSFGYVPQDRHKEGLVLDFSIEDNLIMGLEDKEIFRSRKYFLNRANINQNAKQKIKDYDIRTSSEFLNLGSLSGGNQQKVILARESGENPDFILVAHPTRGLDIGAIEFVHDKLIHLKNENKGVLMISFELDELLALCDKIIVMCGGEITGCLESSEFDKEKIGRMMVGKVGC